MANLFSFSFIFIGDTHGFINDFEKQKEIINSINPKFVLSEQLQDIILDSNKKYKDFLKNKKISNMVSFKEVKKLVNLCYNKKIKLIGIDFRNFGFNSRLQSIIKEKKQASKEDIIKINKILNKREKYHLQIIKKYANLSKKPIIILLGTWHLRDNSLLMKSLNNYIVIYPCDKDGNLLIEPPKNKTSIKYCERIKNE